MANINLQAEISEALTLTVTASASVRANLSISHLLSAGHLSRATGRIENANAGRPIGNFWDELQANAVATILISVAGLEAYANELFVDHKQVFPELRFDVMTKIWELYEQKSIVDKFDFAVLLLKGEAYDKGSNTYQNIAALIQLRNALTHFKPEWSDQQIEHAKISKSLVHRAGHSPFFPHTDSLFPRAWACHKTTNWAVESVKDFLVDFESRTKLNSKVGPFLEQLKAL